MDYQNSKIYKIESITGEGQIYIGSTTKKYLSQRMQGHKHDYKRWKEGKHHKVSSSSIFDLYGVENCKITLLENVDCQSKDELLAREGYYIRTLECVNKQIAGRSEAEYNKTYRLKYKDQISIYQNKKFNCDCGGQYTTSHKARHYKSILHNDWYMNQVD